ncbi:MAG: hypothetical protein AAF353_17975 [Pseudomonadota bacterium]
MQRLFYLIVFLPIVFAAPALNANPLNQATRLLENISMQRLHQQQSQPGVIIEPFKSDGCSGGLSESWKTLASLWPEFANAIGDEPPWEYCCTAHDRDYWRGESIEGFDKRLASDTKLRQCVIQSGDDQGASIANRLGLSLSEVKEVFNLTAELMFHAVRIGGGPCTGLAWRWGHGWPGCDEEIVPLSEDLEMATIPVDWESSVRKLQSED